MMASSGGNNEEMDFTQSATVSESTLSPMFKDGVLADTMPARQINFAVQYNSHNIQLQLPDTEIVGGLKQQLEAKLNIPAAQQDLKGIVKQGVDDSTVLRHLFLPRYSVVYLLARDPVLVPATATSPGRVTISHKCDEYRLIITFNGQSQMKIYNLDAKGSETVGSLKDDLSSLTGVSAQDQQWYGFVSEVTDDTCLCDTGILFPRAQFEVTQIERLAVQDMAPSTAQQSASMEHDMEVNDSVEGENVIHMEDTPIAMTTLKPLMSPDKGSEVEAVTEFYQEFRDRYGEVHPMFYMSSLDEVTFETFHRKPEDRKLLALYLHLDGSVHTDAFCTECLSSETVVNFLCTHFITWGWDLTHSENKAKFLTSAAKHFGDQVADMIKGFSNNHFPMVLIISNTLGSTRVLDVIQGHVRMVDFMTRLLLALDVYNEQKKPDITQYNERMERERLKREEEQRLRELLDFESHLKFLKEGRRSSDKAQKKLKMENDRKERERMKRKKEVDEWNKKRPMPEEPASDAEGVTTVEFQHRLGSFTRRFLLENAVQDLLNFIETKGFSYEQYKVCLRGGESDISIPSPFRTLNQVGFSPQSVVILPSRH